ncbi:amidase [Nocardioidaceae bacterium SCSIO 66511]|nr:amidase [Nocardioidaceae bacterium SCSIO 66511]
MADVFGTARGMVVALRTKRISARELLDAHLDRVEATNSEVNAVVSLDAERARESAREADDRLARGDDVGPLHGLPFAFKDTHAAAGWRTTYGSPLMADNVPERDDLVVERVRAAGAITIGKTNTPEWAAGSHTFNPIFGTTHNPYDRSRSAGGSSGGAAAALASGMVPLADGSDMGGSLRNPASFCNVVGLRPSVGRVPNWPAANGWESLSVAGPMARNVGDLAMLLSVMAGPSSRSPISLEAPGSTYAGALEGDLRGLRVGFSIDLGGAFEVDSAVAAIVGAQRDVLADAGAQVDDAYPDLTGADEVFRTLRAWHFQFVHGQRLAEEPDGFKSSLADNIRAGEGLSGADIARAFGLRTQVFERMREFFDRHDVLAMPVSQVPPFPADQEYPESINGRAQETYLDWMRSAYFITVTGCPAISLPAGFTDEGWPVGLQLVAPPHGERRLLEIAHAYEQLVDAGARRPAL